MTEYKVQYTFFRASRAFKSSFSASASSSTSISISCTLPPSSCDLTNYKIIEEISVYVPEFFHISAVLTSELLAVMEQ